MDPIWHGSKSELPYLNSLKMKMSIVIGAAPHPPSPHCIVHAPAGTCFCSLCQRRLRERQETYGEQTLHVQLLKFHFQPGSSGPIERKRSGSGCVDHGADCGGGGGGGVAGVTHMNLGILMSYFNQRYFRDTLSMVCEFIPQMIFLNALFGYLSFLIVLKWCARTCAPPPLPKSRPDPTRPAATRPAAFTLRLCVVTIWWIPVSGK